MIEKVFRKFLFWIRAFNMIQRWDKVMLAISWWKDSMTLLDLFVRLKKTEIFEFDLSVCYIIPKVPWIIIHNEKIVKIFQDYWVEYHIQELDIPEESKLMEWIKEGTTCQWCALSRRIAIYKVAEKIKANRIAYWHHMDDSVITMFMNIQNSTNLQIMEPVVKLNKFNSTVIRPLILLREKEIRRYTNTKKIPILKANCPLDKHWFRHQIKTVLENAEKELPDFVFRSFKSYIKKTIPNQKIFK